MFINLKKTTEDFCSTIKEQAPQLLIADKLHNDN